MPPSRSLYFLYIFILIYSAFILKFSLKTYHSEERKISLYDVDVDCTPVLTGKGNVAKLKRWKLNLQATEKIILTSDDACSTIKDLFGFFSEPLSEEEENYPLAYGIVVHKDIVQLLLMLSSIYQPQNEYCLAMSGSSKVIFKSIVKALPQCFPNIHVLNRPPITWGSFEIINSTYSCLEYLTELETPWRYYQAWNGTPNIDFVTLPTSRYRRKKPSSSPLPLTKSTLSASFSRETADFIIQSPKTNHLLNFLKGTTIPDESFWSSLLGNIDKFPVPGSFNAKEIMKYRKTLYLSRKNEVDKYMSSLQNITKVKDNYFLTRIQYWKRALCKGKMVSGSCVFGISDVPFLIPQPHIVAHKLYIHYQPAAFMCIIKETRRRTLNPENFDTTKYSQLPLVELQRGVPLQNLTNPLWLFSMFENLKRQI